MTKGTKKPTKAIAAPYQPTEREKALMVEDAAKRKAARLMPRMKITTGDGTTHADPDHQTWKPFRFGCARLSGPPITSSRIC